MHVSLVAANQITSGAGCSFQGHPEFTRSSFASTLDQAELGGTFRSILSWVSCSHVGCVEPLKHQQMDAFHALRVKLKVPVVSEPGWIRRDARRPPLC